MSSLYWLVTDETNANFEMGTFFIYGGLIFTPAQLIEAHNMVSVVREKYGFAPKDQLKFDTRSRPKHMDLETWTAAKAEVISGAVDAQIKMVVYVVHHNIAGPNKSVTTEYALNAVLTHFDLKFLSDHIASGVVCIDRLEEKFAYDYLKRRFQEPLSLPSGKSPRLERIIHYSVSCDGASHVSSLVDIALGGFRYCVNAAMGQGTEAVARRIFPAVVKLMWTDPVGHIGGYGYLQYPKIIKYGPYKDDYSKLRRVLATYLGEAATEEPE